jgi:hypothetical protein
LCNPELHAVGNVMLQSMLHRIDFHRKDLRQLRNQYRRNHTEFPRFSAEFAAEVEAWNTLDEAIANLRASVVRSDFAVASNAACAAVQLVNAFGTCGSLDWLELPEIVHQDGAATLQNLVNNRLTIQVAERISQAVTLLVRYFSEERLSRTQAVATGGLVLVSSTQRVWWRSEEVTPVDDFTDYTWRLLEMLAKRAGMKEPITKYDFYGQGTTKSDQAFRMQVSNLKKAVRNIRDFEIKSEGGTGKDRGKYRLHLNNADIYIFGDEANHERRL